MKNKISDLRNTLFEMIERLNDDDLSGEELNEQLKKAKIITGLAHEITESANCELKAVKTFNEEFGIDVSPGNLLGWLNEGE